MIPTSVFDEPRLPGSLSIVTAPLASPYSISFTVRGHTLRLPISKQTAKDLQSDPQARLRATEALIRIAHAAR
jgi:hypothetical protein